MILGFSGEPIREAGCADGGVKYPSPKVLWMRLERRLGAMSSVGSTVALALTAVAMASLVHLGLYFDGAKLTGLAFSHIVIETLAVAVPLLLYSRRVIGQLEKAAVS